jgi:hypothetical protein
MAFVTLIAVSCSKDNDSNGPITPTKDSTKISFTYDRLGTGEFYDLLTQELPAVNITYGKSSAYFTYEITGSNGLKSATDTIVKGSGKLDNLGRLSLTLPGLYNYKDGIITLKATFTEISQPITVTVPKTEYQIRNYRDFMHMAFVHYRDSADHFVQVQDFAFPDTVFTTSVISRGFSGSYDGQGFKITNLTINSPGATNATTFLGLFQTTDSATVLKNIKLELSDKGITATRLTVCGGLVGWAWKSIITNCSVKGDILIPKANLSYTGGIAGNGTTITMTGCAFKGRLSGTYVGGLVAEMSASTVNMCYVYFTFDATYAAGFVCTPSSGDPQPPIYISNSYVVVYDYTKPTLIAVGPMASNLTYTVASNCFANAGTPQEGVTIYDTPVDINTQLAALTVTDWPSWITAPTDKKPFKYDPEDHTTAMKLWWE